MYAACTSFFICCARPQETGAWSRLCWRVVEKEWEEEAGPALASNAPGSWTKCKRNVARPHHRGRAPVTPARTCGNPAEAVRFSLNDAIYLTSDERRPAQPPMT